MPDQAREWADTTTGEIVLSERVVRPKVVFRPDSQGRRYVLVGAMALEMIENTTYDGTTLRILVHIIRTTDSSGLVQSTQAEIARHFGVSRATVSRAFKKLEEDHHLYKRGPAWFLNAETAFTGTGEQHQEAVKRLPDDARIRVPLRAVPED